MDLAVPHRTARDTARRTEGTLVTDQRGGHSWLLRDPESLPAIMTELLAGPLGDGIRKGLRSAGLRKKNPTLADVEEVCYRAGGARCSPWLRPTPTRKVVGATASRSTPGPRAPRGGTPTGTDPR